MAKKPRDDGGRMLNRLGQSTEVLDGLLTSGAPMRIGRHPLNGRLTPAGWALDRGRRNGLPRRGFDRGT